MRLPGSEISRAKDLWARGDVADAASALRAARAEAEQDYDSYRVKKADDLAASFRKQIEGDEERLRVFDAFYEVRHGEEGQRDVDPVEREPVVHSGVGVTIALIGAALMLIAVFLPRVESNTFGRVAQNTLIQSGGGWWFVGLAVATAASGWLAYQRQVRSVGPMISGLIAIGVALFYGLDKDSLTLCPTDSSVAEALGVRCEKASPGIGIYVAGVGGVLAVVGGWHMWRAKPKSVTEPAHEQLSTDVEATPVAKSDDLEARLERLEALRAKSLLTDDEYTERRARLLDEL